MISYYFVAPAKQDSYVCTRRDLWINEKAKDTCKPYKILTSNSADQRYLNTTYK